MVGADQRWWGLLPGALPRSANGALVGHSAQVKGTCMVSPVWLMASVRSLSTIV
jgi:hypothetical protein